MEGMEERSEKQHIGMENEVMLELKELKNDIAALDMKVVQGFETMHNFGRDRIKIFQQATTIRTHAVCDGYLSSHSFYFKGKVGSLTAIR